jgi:hypothetical protein
MPCSITRSATLTILVVGNVLASGLHFGDNALRFDDYPEPTWITGPVVVESLWLMITPLLLAGWIAARRGSRWAAATLLWSYGVLSLFVLGHYLYESPTALSLRINFLIGIEAVAAILLIVLVPILLRAPGERPRA